MGCGLVLERVVSGVWEGPHLEGNVVDAEGGPHARKHALFLVNLLNGTQS